MRPLPVWVWFGSFVFVFLCDVALSFLLAIMLSVFGWNVRFATCDLLDICTVNHFGFLLLVLWLCNIELLSCVNPLLDSMSPIMFALTCGDTAFYLRTCRIMLFWGSCNCAWAFILSRFGFWIFFKLCPNVSVRRGYVPYLVIYVSCLITLECFYDVLCIHFLVARCSPSCTVCCLWLVLFLYLLERRVDCGSVFSSTCLCETCGCDFCGCSVFSGYLIRFLSSYFC